MSVAFCNYNKPQDDPPLVVVCAGSSWEGIVGSDRQMATALTNYTDVLWVDPPYSFLSPGRHQMGAGRIPRPILRSIGRGLTRLTPTALPGHSRPGINATTGHLVRAQIRWALKQLKKYPSAVIACTLEDVLTGWTPGVRRVLYCTDDYTAGAELMGVSRSLLIKKERRQLANSDFVVTISQVLSDKWSNMGARVLLIPNGVEVDAYENMSAIAPAEDVSLAPPVAGVVGHLSARIDIGLLETVADAGISLLLVGPYDSNWEPMRFAALTKRPNVVWTGRREFSDLPAYFRRMNVGLTPYADSDFNRASFPLKTLEYLAAGIPAVSTDLPATRWLNTDLVKIASTPTEFVQAIWEDANESTNQALVKCRQEFAAGHSWDSRARELVRALKLERIRFK